MFVKWWLAFFGTNCILGYLQKIKSILFPTDGIHYIHHIQKNRFPSTHCHSNRWCVRKHRPHYNHMNSCYNWKNSCICESICLNSQEQPPEILRQCGKRSINVQSNTVKKNKIDFWRFVNKSVKWFCKLHYQLSKDDASFHW